jgi:N-methylhydantoinase B
MNIDPVTLTVIEKGLQHVCSEMDLTHDRTAFSPVISEGFDRSNGIYRPSDGGVIAQGELGMPIFIGVMQETTREVIEHRNDLGDGDIILVNDPYFGGTHLMDVKMVKPFFYSGRLWCFLSNTGHWPDTGGMVPGGFSSTATEIHQEGLRIPPVKLVRRGEIQQDIVDLVLANVRVSEERIGDIKAQIGALDTGEKRLRELLDRYGADTVEAAIEELEVRSERMMRSKIRTIPDGSYSSIAYIDSDGIVDAPLEIRLTATIADDEIELDLGGSSPPCLGPMNSVWASTLSACYLSFKHIFPDVPINVGCFKPIKIKKPKGTFLYAKYPKPVAGCAAEVSQRIVEAVFLALVEVIPDKVYAAPAGTSGNFSLGGYDPQTDSHYIMYFFSGGGYGGWWKGDGISNGCSTIGISKTQPVEILEQRYPILFERYALREGSAGAGRYRGGFGTGYRVRLLRGEATASFLMDHGRYGPPGVLGGEAGLPNEIMISQAGRRSTPPHRSKGEGYRLEAGDWVDVRTPGGGGYGNPDERSAVLAERDKRCGYFDTVDAGAGVDPPETIKR